jgi:hypothetical protein
MVSGYKEQENEKTLKIAEKRIKEQTGHLVK